MTENNVSKKSATMSTRSSYLDTRKQRIEQWAFSRPNPSGHSSVSAATALLRSVSARKRSENSIFQANRMLNVQLLQLSMERQQTIERSTFDQKLFVYRQALKHKHHQPMLDILNYARGCLKHADTRDARATATNSTEQSKRMIVTKRSHSRASSPTRSPPAKRSLSANVCPQTSTTPIEAPPEQVEKPVEPSDASPANDNTVERTATPPLVNATPMDDDSQKRHVQFQMNAGSYDQPANVTNESLQNHEVKQTRRSTISVPAIRPSSSLHKSRSTSSAPPARIPSSLSTSTNEQQRKRTPTVTSSISRFIATKSSLRDFRLHPERYISTSNCYMPLLRRQALENETNESPSKPKSAHFPRSYTGLSAESDAVFDDTRLFLSEDNDTGKPAVHSLPSSSTARERQSAKARSARSIPASHTTAMARLREREFARLNTLIHSDLIEKVIEPMVSLKSEESAQQRTKQQSISGMTDQSSLRPARARQLADILRSIDSLSCSDAAEKRARKEADMAKNRAKLGILIF